jgi:hypothetical protein
MTIVGTKPAWADGAGAPYPGGYSGTAWTKISSSISFTNMNGYVENYDIWISNTAQNSPIAGFVIS